MKNGITTISGWISAISGLLQQLIVLGVVVDILYSDYFGVIANIGKLMTGIGEAGLAGLVALILVATWYKK